jgi:hypothetical protein
MHSDEGIRPRRGRKAAITKHPRPHHKAPEAASHPFMSVEYLALHAYQFGVGKSVLLTLAMMCILKINGLNSIFRIQFRRSHKLAHSHGHLTCHLLKVAWNNSRLSATAPAALLQSITQTRKGVSRSGKHCTLVRLLEGVVPQITMMPASTTLFTDGPPEKSNAILQGVSHGSLTSNTLPWTSIPHHRARLSFTRYLTLQVRSSNKHTLAGC